MNGVGQMNLIQEGSVVKLAERRGTLGLEVGVCVVLASQVTGAVVSTPITMADM
jgi:hypothetical protein